VVVQELVAQSIRVLDPTVVPPQQQQVVAAAVDVATAAVLPLHQVAQQPAELQLVE
jgi:hypothetical protein